MQIPFTFFILIFSVFATSAVNASDLPKFDSPPDEVVYRGVTEEQWETISRIGDPLNCRQRVYDLQSLNLDEFYEITAEQFNNNPGLLNAVFAEYENIILREGTYKSSGITLYNKILIGYPGERIIFDATDAVNAFTMSNSILSNVIIQNAKQIGIKLLDGNLTYRVVVGNTGLYNSSSRRGIGFNQSGDFGSKNNCLVSVEAYNGWNNLGKGLGARGGSADGFDVKMTKENNFTFIDAHGHHNSDHGFDFFGSGNKEKIPVVRMYYSSAIYNKNPYKIGGDGGGIKMGGQRSDNEFNFTEVSSTPRILYSTVSCYNPGPDSNIHNKDPIKIKKINSSNDPHNLKCSDFSYIKKIKERSFDIVIKPPKKGCDIDSLKLKKCRKKIDDSGSFYIDEKCVEKLKDKLNRKGCGIE